jgi:WD40 repeat protein
VGDLAEGTTHVFELSRDVTQELERRLLDEHYTISFRIDGPLAGDDSLFAWDTGRGAASKGARPRLLLNVGAPPRTPVPSGTPPFVVVTSTPTPASVLAAAAVVRTATAMAETTGQPTPTSVYEWTATPQIIVTSTPTPRNQATSEHMAAVITAVALTTGTTTPTPSHLVTATPTPLIIRAQDLTPAPPPTPTPLLPSGLQGRILFQSDRMEDTGPWVVDPDGGDVSVLTADWPYEVAASQEPLSPDGRYVLYVGKVQGDSAILIRPVGSREGSPLAVSDGGGFSSPTWSPTWNPIAFVYSGDQGSQIWVVSTDGTGMRRLTLPEWGEASAPTFSPDGTRLAYANDDGDGRRQLWVINLRGTGRIDLSHNLYDEYNPVWVK